MFNPCCVMFTCVHAYTQNHTHNCASIHTHPQMSTRAHARSHAHVRMRAHRHTNTPAHTRTSWAGTHMHAHHFFLSRTRGGGHEKRNMREALQRFMPLPRGMYKFIMTQLWVMCMRRKTAQKHVPTRCPEHSSLGRPRHTHTTRG